MVVTMEIVPSEFTDRKLTLPNTRIPECPIRDLGGVKPVSLTVQEPIAEVSNRQTIA